MGWLVWRWWEGWVYPAIGFPVAGRVAVSFAPRWKHHGAGLMAILLGACSHVLWDGFTHAHGWFVEHSLWLSAAFVPAWDPVIPRYKVLQHGSTLLGTTSLLILARKRFPKRIKLQAAILSLRKYGARLGLFVGTIVLCAVGNALRVYELGLLRMVGNGVVGSMWGIFLSFTLLAMGKKQRWNP
jgi:hypothetical protein